MGLISFISRKFIRRRRAVNRSRRHNAQHNNIPEGSQSLTPRICNVPQSGLCIVTFWHKRVHLKNGFVSQVIDSTVEKNWFSCISSRWLRSSENRARIRLLMFTDDTVELFEKSRSRTLLISSEQPRNRCVRSRYRVLLQHCILQLAQFWPDLITTGHCQSPQCLCCKTA